jgi:hypothetical protein
VDFSLSRQESTVPIAVFKETAWLPESTTPLIPFNTAPAAPTANDIADDHSLLKIDRELEFLMEQIEDEIEESGEASNPCPIFSSRADAPPIYRATRY